MFYRNHWRPVKRQLDIFTKHNLDGELQNIFTKHNLDGELQNIFTKQKKS